MSEEWLSLTYDDDYGIFYFFEDMGRALAEAILSADLSEEERESWAERLTPWANEISDYGYHHAVRWLDKARRAAEAAGTLDEWRTSVQDIRQRHSRKYKLAPMLDELLEKSG
ncbi:MAG: hypothetical protein MAG451_00157 [Anaerolineales bacterium]|nr:hypothetical protein [Anaerolineales bacterium]